MTSITKTVYASNCEIAVASKDLHMGRYIQLFVDYDQPENDGLKDTIVITLDAVQTDELIKHLVENQGHFRLIES
jgi:hypothetical protein